MSTGPLHGPYWYGYWREPGGAVRSMYIGKTLPVGPVQPSSTVPARFAWDGTRMDTLTAMRILGVASRAEVARAYRHLVLRYHPDRARREADRRRRTQITKALNVARDVLLA